MIDVIIEIVGDTGKTYQTAKQFDIGGAISCVRYYAGWADKIHGYTIEVFLRLLRAVKHDA